MSNNNTAQDHVQRINRVLNYIQEHLDQPMLLETLADVACFSPFHFHRIFLAYLGETLSEYIRRIRLERAALKLCYSIEAIGDIGINVGYETPSAFTKAFKKSFGVSPKVFRKKSAVFDTKDAKVNFNFKSKEEYMQPVIIEREETKVIFVRRHGAYASAAEQAWQELCAFAGPRQLISKDAENIGISYDDPATTKSSKLRYDACISVTKDIKVEGEIGLQTIVGGRYAVFHHSGPHEMLEEAYKDIYSQWLPQSGCNLADAPCFEKYLNSPGDVLPEQLNTEIYIPIL